MEKQEFMLNPIIDWSKYDVWDFIKERGVPFNPLYSCGYKRVGCIGCPQAGRMKAELEANPKYKALYINAAGKYLDYRKTRGKPCDGIYKDVETYFKWWVSGKRLDGEETLYD
jgi:phosphoadenosine phosphosulfate reductase